MNLQLIRKEFREDGIFSDLQSEDGKFFCFALEHSYGLKPKLKNGTYTCKRGPHRLASMEKSFITFEIEDVPGHTDILFHVGNYEKDSEGCVLLGAGMGTTSKGGKMLTSSKVAFAQFMEYLKDVDTFTLTVEGSPDISSV
jgi:hypothetical protein